MNSQKKSFTFHLTDENFQEFYNYLTNEEGKKYPKRLEKILIRRKPKIGGLFLKIKGGIFPKRQNLYQIKRKLYKISNLFISTFFMKMNKIKRNVS